MNKQQVLYSTVILSGTFLIGYGLFGLHEQIWDSYKQLTTENGQTGLVIARLVDLLPLIFGYKMVSSPALFYSLISSASDNLQLKDAEEFTSRLKIIAGIILLAISIPYLFEALVRFYYYDPTKYVPELVTAMYVWHSTSIFFNLLITLYGYFLYKKITPMTAINRIKNFGLTSKSE